MTSENITVVITTIFQPTAALVQLADMARTAGWNLLVVGDRKTPGNFSLQGARYLDLQAQRALGWKLAPELPCDHYARKNLGYLEAMARGAQCIVETDDDNIPLPSFFSVPETTIPCRIVRDSGWANVYRLFTSENIWPRGYPLERVLSGAPVVSNSMESVYCPIQQGLADEDPDVDAIYRLIVGKPVIFEQKLPVALAPGAVCPVNSQNTTWWPDAYALMYLPSSCSFRLTDIWRGLIATRIAAAQGWHVLFRSSSVRQERNEHNFMDDFAKEMDGYLRAGEVEAMLAAIRLPETRAGIPEAMLKCYEVLSDAGLFEPEEIRKVESWLVDVEEAGRRAKHD